MPATALSPGASRKRRSDALRRQGGLVAPVRLSGDHLNMLVAAGWLDTREADAAQDDGRLYARLYAQACGEAIGRILDGLSKKPSRVTSTPKGPW